jgi:hypothetical protein
MTAAGTAALQTGAKKNKKPLEFLPTAFCS